MSYQDHSREIIVYLLRNGEAPLEEVSENLGWERNTISHHLSNKRSIGIVEKVGDVYRIAEEVDYSRLYRYLRGELEPHKVSGNDVEEALQKHGLA